MTNIQNINDNKCFKWYIVRYLHSAGYHLPRIWKTDDLLADVLNFEDVKFLFKIKYIYKIGKKHSISISVFGHENMKKHLIYIVKKYYENKNVDFLLIREEDKKHYVLIKDLIPSCVIILYIAEKNIFAVIVYKISVREKC